VALPAIPSSSLSKERSFSTGQAWMSGARKKTAFTGGMNTTGISFSAKETVQPRQHMDDTQVSWQTIKARTDRELIQRGEIGGMLQAVTENSNVEDFGRPDALHPADTGMDDSNQTPTEVRHDGFPHDPVILVPSSITSAACCSILSAKL
jgi:hypothetical protein